MFKNILLKSGMTTALLLISQAGFALNATQDAATVAMGASLGTPSQSISIPATVGATLPRTADIKRQILG